MRHMPKKQKKQKRANGEGSFYEAGGVWYGSRIVYGEGGHPVRKTVSSADKATAWTKFEALKGVKVEYSPNTTFEVIAKAWYDSLKDRVAAGKMEESTRVSYWDDLKRLFPVFGKKAIGEFQADDIDTGVDGLRKPDGQRYSFRVYKISKFLAGKVFNYAEKKGIITAVQNPMRLVERLVNTEKKKVEKQAYEIDEIRIILKARALFANDEKMYRYYCAVIVGMAGAFRSQEMAPLTQSDIEPDGSGIDVNKAAKRGEKGAAYIGNPKTVESNRFTDLPEFAWPFAKWLRDHAVNGYVFYSERTHAQIHLTTYAEYLKRVVASIEGIRNLKPHEIQRHTGITTAFESGAERRDVKAHSGHADDKSVDGYDHAGRVAKKRVATKINEIVTME
jgi:site-specific recombinase XerD